MLCMVVCLINKTLTAVEGTAETCQRWAIFRSGDPGYRHCTKCLHQTAESQKH